MSNDLYKALQQCLKLLDSGVPAEECLARYPQHSIDLEPLLTAATVDSFRMPVADKMRVRQRVMAHWDVKHAPRQRWWMSFGWSTRWAAAAAVLVIMLVTGGVGTAAAAQNAVPGSSFYTVKLLREDVRLWFARSAEEKVQIYADYSRERVQEILRLTTSDQQDLSQAPLARLEENLAAIDEIRAESVIDASTYSVQEMVIVEALDELLPEDASSGTVSKVLQPDAMDTYPCLQHTLQVLRQAREQVNASLEAVGQGLPRRALNDNDGMEALCPH